MYFAAEGIRERYMQVENFRAWMEERGNTPKSINSRIAAALPDVLCQ